MKNLILAFCLVSAPVLKLAAQNVPAAGTSSVQNEMRKFNPGDRARQDANKAAEKLALTPDQKTKWEAASLERINSNQMLKEKMNNSTTPQERKNLRIQMKTNNDTFKNSIYAFLTPEQKTKYEQMQKEKHDARKSRMHSRNSQSQQSGNTNTQ
jgi:protein CpxP